MIFEHILFSILMAVGGYLCALSLTLTYRYFFDAGRRPSFDEAFIRARKDIRHILKIFFRWLAKFMAILWEEFSRNNLPQSFYPELALNGDQIVGLMSALDHVPYEGLRVERAEIRNGAQILVLASTGLADRYAELSFPELRQLLVAKVTRFLQDNGLKSFVGITHASPHRAILVLPLSEATNRKLQAQLSQPDEPVSSASIREVPKDDSRL